MSILKLITMIYTFVSDISQPNGSVTRARSDGYEFHLTTPSPRKTLLRYDSDSDQG